MPRSGEGQSRREKPNLHSRLKVIIESAIYISESDVIRHSTCQFEKSDVVALEKCQGDSLASPIFKDVSYVLFLSIFGNTLEGWKKVALAPMQEQKGNPGC